MELERLEDQQDFSTKAVYDYTYALKRCYDTRAAWIVIFEDDILLADGWFVKTLQGISDIQRLFAASSNDWLFLRLFNQERSTGWASSIPGQNHETLISILIMIPTFWLSFCYGTDLHLYDGTSTMQLWQSSASWPFRRLSCSSSKQARLPYSHLDRASTRKPLGAVHKPWCSLGIKSHGCGTT